MTRRLAATMAIDLRRQVTEGFWLVAIDTDDLLKLTHSASS